MPRDVCGMRIAIYTWISFDDLHPTSATPLSALEHWSMSLGARMARACRGCGQIISSVLFKTKTSTTTTTRRCRWRYQWMVLPSSCANFTIKIYVYAMYYSICIRYTRSIQYDMQKRQIPVHNIPHNSRTRDQRQFFVCHPLTPIHTCIHRRQRVESNICILVYINARNVRKRNDKAQHGEDTDTPPQPKTVISMGLNKNK